MRLLRVQVWKGHDGQASTLMWDATAPADDGVVLPWELAAIKGPGRTIIIATEEEA